MTLIEEIQSALKEGNVVIGYNESLEFLRNDSPKLMVVANNIQDNKRKELEHDANISGIKMETFDGSSVELGVICGKPFPISVLVIKK
jgi:large subunit ribosomal protein L30e